MARKRTGRPPGRPPGTPAFARVQRAREALQKQAAFYVENHKKAATVAASKGNSAPAEWALTHIAAVDEQGKEQRVVAPSVDRPAAQIDSGPRIQIGIGFANPGAIGSFTPREAPLALPAVTVDAVDADPVADHKAD